MICPICNEDHSSTICPSNVQDWNEINSLGWKTETRLSLSDLAHLRAVKNGVATDWQRNWKMVLNQVRAIEKDGPPQTDAEKIKELLNALLSSMAYIQFVYGVSPNKTALDDWHHVSQLLKRHGVIVPKKVQP